MAAREGFLTADIGVLALHHRRIRKLRNDLGETEAAVLSVIWLELVLASWAEGDRLEVGEIDSPAELTDERTDRLRAAGLIDAGGRIPAKAWQEWFGAAADRRADRKARGQKGAAARYGKVAATAQAMPEQSPSNSSSNAVGNTRPSVRPSAKTDETDETPNAPARASGAPALEVNPRYRNGSPRPTVSTQAPAPDPKRPVEAEDVIAFEQRRSAAVVDGCADVPLHRKGYVWRDDPSGWHCPTCEAVGWQAARDDPSRETFKQKAERLAAARAEDLAESSEPEGMF